MKRDEAFAVEGHVGVEVELAAGSVLVQSGEAGVVRVSVDCPTADGFEIVRIGDSISVSEGRRRRSARIVVDVPAGTDLYVRCASTDIQTRGAIGVMRVRAASSDVVADHVERLELAVASGDVRIDAVRGDATLTATSGDVHLRSVMGDLSASLSSGDLRIGRIGGVVDTATASGDVSLARCDGASISVRTQSGDIRVGLPSGIRVDPDLSTMSGKVTLPTPGSSGPSPDDGPRRSVRLRLRSVSGNILVERSS